MTAMPAESKWPATPAERFSLALLERIAIVLGSLVASQVLLQLSLLSQREGLPWSDGLQDYFIEVGPGALAIAVIVPATHGILSGSRSAAVRSLSLVHAWLWVLPWLDAWLRRGNGLDHIPDLPWAVTVLVVVLAAQRRARLLSAYQDWRRLPLLDPGADRVSAARMDSIAMLELAALFVLTVILTNLVRAHWTVAWCESMRELGCRSCCCVATSQVRDCAFRYTVGVAALVYTLGTGLALARLGCSRRIESRLRFPMFLAGLTLAVFRLLEVARLGFDLGILRELPIGDGGSLHSCDWDSNASSLYPLAILALITSGPSLFLLRLILRFFPLAPDSARIRELP